MRVTCDHCQARYRITVKKASGKTVTFKCGKCGNLVRVSPEEAKSPPDPGAPEGRPSKKSAAETIRVTCSSCGTPFLKPATETAGICYQCRIDSVVSRIREKYGAKEGVPEPGKVIEESDSRYVIRTADGLVLGPIKLRTVAVLARERRIRGTEEAKKDDSDYKPVMSYPELAELFPDMKEIMDTRGLEDKVEEAFMAAFGMEEREEVSDLARATAVQPLEQPEEAAPEARAEPEQVPPGPEAEARQEYPAAAEEPGEPEAAHGGPVEEEEIEVPLEGEEPPGEPAAEQAEGLSEGPGEKPSGEPAEPGPAQEPAEMEEPVPAEPAVEEPEEAPLAQSRQEDTAPTEEEARPEEPEPPEAASQAPVEPGHLPPPEPEPAGEGDHDDADIIDLADLGKTAEETEQAREQGEALEEPRPEETPMAEGAEAVEGEAVKEPEARAPSSESLAESTEPVPEEKVGTEFELEDEEETGIGPEAEDVIEGLEPVEEPPPDATYRIKYPDGLMLGPVRIETIRELFNTGSLTGQEDIQRDDGPWLSFTDMPELYEFVSLAGAEEEEAREVINLTDTVEEDG